MVSLFFKVLNEDLYFWKSRWHSESNFRTFFTTYIIIFYIFSHLRGMHIAQGDYAWKFTIAATVLAGFGFMAFKMAKTHLWKENVSHHQWMLLTWTETVVQVIESDTYSVIIIITYNSTCILILNALLLQTVEETSLT